VTRPYLERIRDLTGETVSLHLRVGGERVCVDGVESPHVVRRVLPLGQPIPLYSGPSGKVILAYLPKAEIEKITKSAHLPTEAHAVLTRQLDEIARLGFLVAIGDRTAGVGAVSVPLFDPVGPVASITVAGPADRWNLKRLREHAPAIADMASQISAALGGRRP
jgi:DNA-binding IclR family transcriptional regulator